MRQKMRKNVFTLVELLTAVIIVGILASIALSAYQGRMIRMKMRELYTTVDAITKAEEAFYARHTFFAAHDGMKEHRDYWLSYTITQEDIDRFERTLGIKIPGLNSTFLYGVYYDPAQIYVRVREHPGDPSDGGWWVLCYINLAGRDKGKWGICAYNPWSKYLKVPGEAIMNYTFVNK
jgi:prepilin-type N-terminal cleavage/methylation domain-containing protein